MSAPAARAVAWTLVGASLLLLLATASLAAPATEVEGELGLQPAQPPGFIALQACVVEITIQCNEGRCVLRTSQAYRIYNRDRIKAETLVLAGVPHGAAWQGIDLRDGSGNALPKRVDTSADAPLWDLTLSPDERKTLLFTHQRELPQNDFVRWRWDTSLLTRWQGVASLRVNLTLPGWTPAGAVHTIEPQGYRFDGREILWDYETVTQYPEHEIVLLSPETWQRLQTLQNEGQHHDLAKAYLTLYDAAERQGIPMAEPFAQVIGELLAAIEAAPDALAPRLDLAALYRTRSNDPSAVGLNYVLLAAEQLQRALDGMGTGAHPQRDEVAQLLAQTYYEAALQARRMGDTAGGLLYLSKAERISAVAPAGSSVSREDMALQWALDMAEKGMVSQALTEMRDHLSPGLEDAFLRYAPPISAARTHVTVGPTQRRAAYVVTPYKPVADQTRSRMEELGQALASIDGIAPEALAVTIHESDGAPHEIVVEIIARYRSEHELRDLAAAIRQTIGEDQDLLAALLAWPWHSEAGAARREETPWSERYRYHERVDLAELADTWERESRYAQWRLVELQSATASGERERIEHQLAVLALREQWQVWQRLPAASYWVYSLEWGQASEEEARSWMLSWQQHRDLSVEIARYRWPFILRGLGLVMLVVLVLGLVIATNRRKFRPTHTS